MPTTPTDELNFDLTPMEVPVTIGGKPYILREASEDAACKWRNTALSKARMENGKVQTVGNLADLQPMLVSLCLFERADNGTEKAVRVETVRTWPTRVVTRLFERAKEISGLNEGEDDTEASLEEKIQKLTDKLEKVRQGDTPAKNSPDSTPDSST